MHGFTNDAGEESAAWWPQKGTDIFQGKVFSEDRKWHCDFIAKKELFQKCLFQAMETVEKAAVKLEKLFEEKVK